MDSSVVAIAPDTDEVFALARRLADELRRANALNLPYTSEGHRREVVVWRAMSNANMTGRRGQMMRRAEVFAASTLDAIITGGEPMVEAASALLAADAYLSAAPTVWRSLWKGPKA